MSDHMDIHRKRWEQMTVDELYSQLAAENQRLREALEWAIDKLDAAHEDGFHIDADGNEVTDLDYMRAALEREDGDE